MRNKKGVVPKYKIKAFNMEWRLLVGVTESSTITMKDMEEKTYLKFITKPHGAIEKDIEKLLLFRPKVYYYELIEK